MRSAGNYAFANRNCVTQSLRGALKAHMGTEVDVDVIYDVCHNIARVEEHVVHGSNCNCCVHRKGATRSFGGDSDELSEEFGGRATCSSSRGYGDFFFVMSGPKKGTNQAFGSSCHGAGRAMSRTQAREEIDGAKVKRNKREGHCDIRDSREVPIRRSPRCIQEH